MRDPALRAQRKQAQAQAAAARRMAGVTAERSAESVAGFTEQADQVVGQLMAVAGKTGQMGWEDQGVVESGIDVGEAKSKEVVEMEERLAALPSQEEALRKDIEENPYQQESGGTKMDGSEGRSGNRAPDPRATKLANIKKERAELTKKIEVATKDFTDLEEVRESGEGASGIGGTSRLNIEQYRDKLERDRRSAIRAAQTDVLTQYETGEMYDAMAGYLKQAETMSAIQNTIQLAGRIGLAAYSGGTSEMGFFGGFGMTMLTGRILG